MKMIRELLEGLRRSGKSHSTSASERFPVMPTIADLLMYLPHLKTTPAGNVSFDESDPALLSRLADNAGSGYKIVLRGTAAIGTVLSHAGPQIADGTIAKDSVEALGALVAELSELCGMLVALDVNCRRVLASADVAGNS